MIGAATRSRLFELRRDRIGCAIEGSLVSGVVVIVGKNMRAARPVRRAGDVDRATTYLGCTCERRFSVFFAPCDVDVARDRHTHRVESASTGSDLRLEDRNTLADGAHRGELV